MQTNVQNLITLPKWLTQGRIKTRRLFFFTKTEQRFPAWLQNVLFLAVKLKDLKLHGDLFDRFVNGSELTVRASTNQRKQAHCSTNHAQNQMIRDLHFPAVGAGCMFELWAQIGDWHYLRLLWLARCAYSGFGSKFRSNPCFFTLICSLLHLKSLVIAFVESLYKFWSILFYHNYIFVFAFRRKLD